MDDDRRPRMRIIAASENEVRLVCNACGAHKVVEKRRLGPAVRCTTCDAPRVVVERRLRDRGHAPERRVILPSV
jgi:DNA-directed RNA polymerase subunit RPC12/RpoP